MSQTVLDSVAIAAPGAFMVGFATNKTESFMPPTFDKSRNIQKDRILQKEQGSCP